MSDNYIKRLNISTQKLPCGPADYYFDFIEIEPLVYLDLIYHARNYSHKADRYTKMLYHFNLAIQKVSHFQDLYLPDAIFAIYMLYFYSFSEMTEINFVYVCEKCGNKNADFINLQEIKFKKYEKPEYVLKIPYICLENSEYKVKFDTHKFIYPKVSNVLQELKKLYSPSRKRIYDLDINLLLISHEDYKDRPDMIENYLMNFTTYAAWLLFAFSRQYFYFLESIYRRCKICSHINNININNLAIEDFFAITIDLEDLIKMKSYLESKNFHNVENYTIDVLNKAIEVFIEEEEKSAKEGRTIYSLDREKGISIS